MTITLPKPIAAYFAADRLDGDATTRCFTETAVVVDERRTHEGRDAIRRWKTATAAQYDYVSEPIAVSGADGHFTVTARVTGNFPGSPVDLRYAFTLEDNAITRLEIVQ
ncbi:MAG: nuclear transport factor 2 family protein [Zavarzinia sp.]|nr:nuclear transport factor 2 family protein [Zavarzinia sp.]